MPPLAANIEERGQAQMRSDQASKDPVSPLRSTWCLQCSPKFVRPILSALVCFQAKIAPPFLALIQRLAIVERRRLGPRSLDQSNNASLNQASIERKAVVRQRLGQMVRLAILHGNCVEMRRKGSQVFG